MWGIRSNKEGAESIAQIVHGVSEFWLLNSVFWIQSSEFDLLSN